VKAIEIKGEAAVGGHTVKLEKGATYRISVNAEGFDPTVQVRGQFGVISSTEGYERKANLIFTATESRDADVVVSVAPRGDIDQGAHKYTIHIERAEFSTEKKAQQPLKLDEQTHRLEAGRHYTVTVKSHDFAPQVCILDGPKTVAQ